MLTTPSIAAHSATTPLAPLAIARRAVGPHDVQIDIDYCGICHTDLHVAKNDWGRSVYPIVPGHEIVGRVRAVGAQVTRFAPGQAVAVGCFVGSCGTCSSCADHMEQYCLNGYTLTYGSPSADPGGYTQGGYSKSIVVGQDFVLSLPEGMDAAAAAPLLCAGITSYSPLRHWGIGPGMTVGVIGLGGLGHMGIKLAHAMGAKTVMITTSPGKAADAMRLGANEVLISTDDEAMSAMANQFDFLLNTIPVSHDFNAYMSLLKVDGTMCIVGAIGPNAPLNTRPMILGRRNIAGSLVGGIQETQEMLHFCAAHGIVADIELIKASDLNQAFERMQKIDVKYRVVIDMASLV